MTKHQLQKEVGNKVFIFSNCWMVLQTFVKGHQQRAYLGSSERVPNPSKTISSIQLEDLKQRAKKTVRDKVDTQCSGRSEINCDIFHLFVNVSLAVHSLKTTVASYRIGERRVK